MCQKTFSKERELVNKTWGCYMSLVYKYIQKEPESQRNLSEWPGLHHYSSQYWFAYIFWSSSRRHWYKVEGKGGTHIIPLKDHITRRINSWILMQSPSFNPILRGRGDDDERRSCEDLLCIATVKWFHAGHALLPIRLSQMPSMLHSKLFFFSFCCKRYLSQLEDDRGHMGSKRWNNSCQDLLLHSLRSKENSFFFVVSVFFQELPVCASSYLWGRHEKIANI